MTITDEMADAIIDALDTYARDYDHFDYGLPLYADCREAMRKIIKDALAESDNSDA